MVRLERSELSLLVSLLTLEIGKQGSSSYCQRLTAMRDKLLAGLAEKDPPGNGDLPDFREYARKRYPAELDEDLVTMIEDVIKRQKEKAAQIDSRGNHDNVAAPSLLKIHRDLEKGGDIYSRSLHTFTKLDTEFKQPELDDGG